MKEVNVLELKESEIVYDKERDRVYTSPNNKNIYMPISLLHNQNLKAKEKFYLAMFYQYGESEYYADIGMLDMLNKASLLSLKRKLKKLGFLNSKITPETAKEIVLKNKNIGYVCEWCGTKTTAIHEHHYPIPKSKGGKEIVKICPNCHSEYHLIYKNGEDEK